MTSTLVISAHSADFVWRCGGAIALSRSRGEEVTVVCLSFGERGESAKLWKRGGMTLGAVKDARRGEAERAAAALGVSDIRFLDWGDYPLGYPEGITAARMDALVAILREVRPSVMLSHSRIDPYNTDHARATELAIEARMIAQAWGHEPGGRVLGAPQLYLFEPHQPEQMEWKPDTFLDITSVWEAKRAAIECMEGQEHLWDYYTRVAQNRANHFKRNSGGQAGGRDCRYAEGFESVYPRCVDAL